MLRLPNSESTVLGEELARYYSVGISVDFHVARQLLDSATLYQR